MNGGWPSWVVHDGDCRKLFCNTTGYRYFELLMLVAFTEHNPKDELTHA